MTVPGVIAEVVDQVGVDDPGQLGWVLARELEQQCAVTVNPDFLAEAVKQLEGLPVRELVAGLADVVEADR